MTILQSRDVSVRYDARGTCGGGDARGVVVGRLREEERQGDPKVCKDRAACERDEDRLDEQRLRHGEPRHAAQDAGVRDVGVLRGVVGEPPVEDREDGELHPDGDVVHRTPGHELRDDAREHPREEHAEEEAGEDDGYRGCAPLGRREVRREGHENLRDDVAEGHKEADDLEDNEIGRDCQADWETCCNESE